jgi:hypothetical protein
VTVRSCPRAELVTALMANALQKDRLDIPSSTEPSPCSFFKPSDNLSGENTCQAPARARKLVNERNRTEP